MGLDKRLISKTPNNMWIEKVKGEGQKVEWSGFCLNTNCSYLYLLKDPGKKQDTPDLMTFWDESCFLVVSSNPKVIQALKKIHDAFSSGDIAVWLGGGGVFQNAGLAIAIATSLPKDVTDGWMETDMLAKKLKEDALATGIAERLKKAKKDYFALTPSYNKDNELQFWLNPFDQKSNNYGYFSVQELDQWIDNKGPIPKK